MAAINTHSDLQPKKRASVSASTFSPSSCRALANTDTYTAAAAAKSLQSCPTPCDPIDCSPPGSAVPGILQARTLEWVAISFSNAWKWKVKVKLLSRVRLLVTPWTAACQAPPSVGFSRQEYWSGLPLPTLDTHTHTHTCINWRVDFVGKDPDTGKDWRQEEKGMTEDEMVGWHHRFYGHEFEQTPGHSGGQWSWRVQSMGSQRADPTEWLNWTDTLPVKLFVPLPWPEAATTLLSLGVWLLYYFTEAEFFCTWPFVTHLFHFAWCPWGSFMLQPVLGFPFFEDWIISHCVDGSHFSQAFTHLWTPGLLPPLGHCE